MVLFISIIFLIATILMWWAIAHREEIYPRKISSQNIEEKIARYKQLFPGTDGKGPLFVPTGIFLQSLEFLDAETVSINGYIWQKYPKNLYQKIMKNMTEGFTFPEAKGRVWITPSYNLEFGDYRVVGWRFNGIQLFQKFDYAQYPFDTQRIWMRIWPADFYKNMILIPDLDAYEPINKGGIFGLDENIVQKGYEFKETFFNMELVNYDTNFGIHNYIYRQSSPELHFNIIVKRTLINGFVHHILPVLVVWCILFALTMIMSTDKERRKEVGLSTTGVLSALGAAFFSVLIANSGLRSNFFGQPIVYIEYFYLITYIAIILLALNAFIITVESKAFSFLKWQSNLLPKLLFWPFILGSICLVTYFRIF